MTNKYLEKIAFLGFHRKEIPWEYRWENAPTDVTIAKLQPEAYLDDVTDHGRHYDEWDKSNLREREDLVKKRDPYLYKEYRGLRDYPLEQLKNDSPEHYNNYLGWLSYGIKNGTIKEKVDPKLDLSKATGASGDPVVHK